MRPCRNLISLSPKRKGKNRMPITLVKRVDTDHLASASAAELLALLLSAGGAAPVQIVNKSAPYTLLAADSENMFTGAVAFTLPAAVALPVGSPPLRYGFIVPASGTITITPGAGDSIRYGSLNGATAGAISNGTFGASFWLVNFAVNKWVVVNASGAPCSLVE